MSGLKIRVPESNLYVNTFSMMKAAPTPLPLSEVYTALDTGVVEAVENIPDTAVHNSWAEVAPYMIKTNHMNAPTPSGRSNGFGRIPEKSSRRRPFVGCLPPARGRGWGRFFRRRRRTICDRSERCEPGRKGL